jgi:hypothetical protein
VVGRALPVEKAIEEVLIPETSSLRWLWNELALLAKISDVRLSSHGWVEKSPHGGDAISRKAYALSVFLDDRFVRGEIDTVHLVAGYIAMEPLDLGTQSFENIDRLL